MAQVLGPYTDMKDPDEASNSQLLHGTAPASVTMWGLRQYVYLYISLPATLSSGILTRYILCSLFQMGEI